MSIALTASFLSADAATRIVTVGGAATEIVFALERGDDVVGVDLSSTFPESVRDLPQVGYVRSISAEGVLALEPKEDAEVARAAVQPQQAQDAADGGVAKQRRPVQHRQWEADQPGERHRVFRQ